jgi:hypothetical protein
MYYKFTNKEDAQTALNYINVTLASMFPPELVTQEGIISVNAETGEPDINAAKTTTWAEIKEFKDFYIFPVPTQEDVGDLILPQIIMPVTYQLISSEELEELSNDFSFEQIAANNQGQFDSIEHSIPNSVIS